MKREVLTGDSMVEFEQHGPFDSLLIDPPYGDTSLAWDKIISGWPEIAHRSLKDTGSMWLFGSMRYLSNAINTVEKAGFKMAQDIVWEKHNGSGFHADRFKRVHEHVVHFYKKNSKWRDVYNEVQKTNDAVKKTVRRKRRPPHMGHIEAGSYTSQDGGPKLMRSVLRIRSCHGRAIHPTEKPVELLRILVRSSCPKGGIVGDMFAGSASMGEACMIEGRGYLGMEINPFMADKARRRLESLLQI